MDSGGSWLWVLKIALLMLLILLQGSYHQFVWGLYFLGLLAITVPKYFWSSLKATALSVLLGMFHLLPCAFLLGKFQEHYPYLGGYPYVDYLLTSMIHVDHPSDTVLVEGV